MARFIRLYGLGLAAGAMLALLTACLDFGDKNTTLVNGQTQGGSATGPSPIVAPTPSTCSVVRLAGGIFGDDGSAACATRSGNAIPVNCEAQGTVTPKLADGTDAPPAVHGQNLQLDVVQGAALAMFSQDNANLFNYTLKRTAPGLVQIRAVLVPAGCVALERTYDFP
jgi:hypothetical protein